MLMFTHEFLALAGAVASCGPATCGPCRTKRTLVAVPPPFLERLPALEYPAPTMGGSMVPIGRSAYGLCGSGWVGLC